MRRKPFSVVLFDEVEKAHPDIFNSLLQILEDGRLTDSQGRVVDFKNTVIIMTTNLGTRDISKGFNLGFAAQGDTKTGYERMKNKVNEELKQHFRPEFLNRVDDTVVFHQLTEEDIIQIVDLMIDKVDERLKDRDMGLELSPNAKALLAKKGYDPVLGARPLRRTIQREIEDILSEKILFGELRPGHIVVVDTEGEGEEKKFTFRGEEKSPLPDVPPIEQAAGGAPEPDQGRVSAHAFGLSDRRGCPGPFRRFRGSPFAVGRRRRRRTPRTGARSGGGALTSRAARRETASALLRCPASSRPKLPVGPWSRPKARPGAVGVRGP